MAGSPVDVGVGQAGFVARHGLHTDEQRAAAATAEATDRACRICGRSASCVVDQHGVPRTKWLSTPAFRSALRNGVDFSGAIYSLDTGQRRVHARLRRGRRLRYPGVHRVPRRRSGTRPDDVPGAALGRPQCLGAVRPVLRQRPAGAARRRGTCSRRHDRRRGGTRVRTTSPVSRSSSTSSARSARRADRHRRDAGPRAGRSPSIEPGYQFLSEYRQATLEPRRSATCATLLLDAGLPLGRSRTSGDPGRSSCPSSPLTGLGSADAMVLFRAGGQGDLPRPRPARELHVLARTAQLLPQRLAPAPVAARRGRRQRRSPPTTTPVAGRPGATPPACWSTPGR